MKKSFVFGTVERTTDSRLRISLNREFELLFPDDDPLMACYWSEYSIALMPRSLYREFVEKLMAMPRDVKTQAYRNFFLANSSSMTIDTNHRITLRKQDLDFLRRGGSSLPEGENDKDFEWREELVLSGLYNYIIIKTKANAEKALSPEQMMAYGEFLEQASCAVQAEKQGTVCDSLVTAPEEQ